MSDIQLILKTYWGYNSFRPLQQQIIEAVLQKKDVLALLPTGAGKSVCFQVPALAQEGICLVISPLIALMKDQVLNLTQKGIPALAVYSGMHFMEVKKTLQNAAFGNYKFLYVSPERLETDLFKEFLPAIKPTLIAVDEAHCISQWGYDFRPPYLRIADLRKELPAVPVIALTASATQKVQEDICNKLEFDNSALTFKQSFERPNLSYSIFSPESKETKLKEILINVAGSAIVYCRSRKQCQDIAGLLNLQGINAQYYHAGLSATERNEKQEWWVKNKTRVMVCTNAFGMGIDKPDVRVVVHYHVPDCIENYYQEAGRAGRDGKRAYAVLLYQPSEINTLKEQAVIRYPDASTLKKIYTAIMNHLQVAAGGGEYESYNFDIGLFCKDFNLDILTVTYGLQALAKENLITFNESSFKPSTVEFTVNKNDLMEFERVNPLLEPLIKTLLRTYEGIFDYPVSVYESQLAKILKIDIVSCTKALQQLHQYGIISYTAASEKPQIYLQQNRMYADDFKIDTALLQQRRSIYNERVEALNQYVNNNKQCREQQLAAYFSAPTFKNCGICDNCLNNHLHNLSASQVNHTTDKIQHLLSNGPVQINQLIKSLYPINQYDAWQVIQFLLSEEVLIQTADEFIENGKKTNKKQ